MKALPFILEPPKAQCRSVMGVFEINLRAMKIVFILGLLLTYLVLVFLPSLSRFLSYSVSVEVNTVSQVRTNIQISTRQCV